MAPKTSVVVALAIVLVQVSLVQSSWDTGCSCGSGDNSGHEGGSSGYEKGSSGYEGGSSGYEGGSSGYHGGSSGYEVESSGYHGGSSGYQGESSGYHGGSSGYQGESSGYYGGHHGGNNGGHGHGGHGEALCAGPVVEKEVVVNRAVQVPYTYYETVQSKKCFQKHGSQRSVSTNNFSAGDHCHTKTTTQQVPTTDITVEETPLCKKDCTITDFVLQVPLREIVCRNNALCKKTVRSQQNVGITTTKRTSCDRKLCSQDRVTVTPSVETVCQTYQTTVPRSGVKTVNKQEVEVQHVQLPPYKCNKHGHGGSKDYY